MRQLIFSDFLNSTLFFLDLVKVLLYKPNYLNTYCLPAYKLMYINLRLSNLDNSKINLLFRSLNLLYELVLKFPVIQCGNFRWAGREQALGVVLHLYQLEFSFSFLLLRSICLINKLRLAMILKNIRIFRDFKFFFIISIPFYDITKSGLVTSDWYFDWSLCLFFTLSTTIKTFRELRYLLKLLAFFSDQGARAVVLFRNLSVKKAKYLSMRQSTLVEQTFSVELFRTNSLFRKYLFYFYS